MSAAFFFYKSFIKAKFLVIFREFSCRKYGKIVI